MNNLLDRTRTLAEPRIVAVGGGSGVGRTTLACDLARLMARRGRKVLLVDADVDNPTAHLRFECGPLPPARGGEPLREDGPLAPAIVCGERGRPDVLSLGLSRLKPFSRVGLRAPRLMRALRELNHEVVIIDLPASTDPLWASLFVLSDVPMLVSTTETSGLLGAIGYLRAALVCGLVSHPDAAALEFEVLRAVDGLSADADAAEFRGAFSTSRLSALLDSTLERLSVYLVITQTREAAERDLGHALALTCSHLLDVWPRSIGAIDFDERRWFRQRHEPRGALTELAGPEAQVDAVARALLDTATIDADQPRTRRALVSTPGDALGARSDADAATVKQIYRRLWEGVRRDSPLTTVVLTSTQRDGIIRSLEDSNRELHRWLADRNAHTPNAPSTETAGRPSARPGDAIRTARQSIPLSQRELSLKTKIGLRHLQAIEQFEVDELPRPVYLRGYLREIALALELDVDPLMDAYLTALSETRTSRVLSRSGPTPREPS